MHGVFTLPIIVFGSCFIEHLGETIINLALVGFLCNLKVQYILGSFVFVSVTSRLNLYFRISIFCDTILCTGLDASVYFDVILLTLIRPSSSINIWAKRLWHAIATIMLALSIGATTDFPCSLFNSSAIVLFLSFNVFSLFFVVILAEKRPIFLLQHPSIEKIMVD